MEAIRSFIAIQLPEQIQAALSSIQTSLKKSSAESVKWVQPDHIHLTLKFLGDILTTQIDPVAVAIQRAAVASQPFELHLQSLGSFPNLNRVRVVWVGLNGDLKDLLNLQQTLDIALSEIGYPLDERPFTPHLTLGRLRDRVSLLQQQTIGKAIAALKVENAETFRVGSLCLMQSQLTPTGPIYTCLNSIRL